MKQIRYLNSLNSVRGIDSLDKEIFSTELPKSISNLIDIVKRNHMQTEVIHNVIKIYNESGLEDLDDYLLDEGKVTQEEREIIIESLFLYTYETK